MTDPEGSQGSQLGGNFRCLDPGDLAWLGADRAIGACAKHHGGEGRAP